MNFFSGEVNSLVLHEFDFMHIGAIAFFIIAIILVFVFKDKIAQWKYEKHFLTLLQYLQ